MAKDLTGKLNVPLLGRCVRTLPVIDFVALPDAGLGSFFDALEAALDGILSLFAIRCTLGSRLSRHKG
jgi:hypothetical protein